jgi:cobalt transporter subunit CbtA
MFKTILLSALGAGLAVCVALTALQFFTTEPLILHAEQFEGTGHDHGDVATAAHDHGEGAAAAAEAPEEWSPADGFERGAFTALANLVIGVGASLVLAAVMVLSGRRIDLRSGLLWGVGAFIAVSLLPALGLPPELPGTPAADILDRQVWWAGTAIASAIGLGLIAFGPNWITSVAALAVIVIPHIIGAPVPPSHDVTYPGALAGEFVVASMVVSAVLWGLSGAAVGWLYERLSRTA